MLPDDFTAAMTGAFDGTDEVRPSHWTEAETASVHVVGSFELDGGLLVQRWCEDLAARSFDTVNTFMSDPATGEVLLYAFDSLGFPPDPPARGTWRDGAVSLLRETERGQSQTVFAATPDGFRWSKQYRPTPHDEWTPVVDGELVRATPTQRHVG